MTLVATARPSLVRIALAAALVAGLAGGCALLPGGPGPVGSEPMDCVGVPQWVCEDVARQAREEAAQRGTAVVRLRVRCTSGGGCSDQAGEVTYEALLSNGGTHSSGYGWAMAPEPAPGGPGDVPGEPPVPPTCLGVPRSWCVDLASELDDVDDRSRVVSLVVRCTRVCTETKGEGETVVTLEDGVVHKSGWNYEGAAP